MFANLSDAMPLVKSFVLLLLAHQTAFRQERVFRRVVALAFAESLALGRHTLTQLQVVLGLVEADWTAWYRLFQRRLDLPALSTSLLACTLDLKGMSAQHPYVVGLDGMQVPRVGSKIEGSSWLHNPRSPIFKRAIHRAQRFVHGAMYLPPQQGYSRAVPLRFWPAFTEKATRREQDACKEWEAGGHFLAWVRQQLDGLDRSQQRVLALADGAYDTVGLWRQLPGLLGVTLLARSAKNRALYRLPTRRLGQRGRPRKYGTRLAAPQALLRRRRGWRNLTLTVRGRPRTMRYQVWGPVVRRGAAETPLFLIIVRGQTYTQGQKRRYREPLYYLVNARWEKGDWQLPFEVATLLFWAWQRWEMEVTHRELKSGFGLGEKQCWHPTASVTSVQWSAWVYSLLMVAAYQTWQVCDGPPTPTRWWRGSPRWSLNTVLRTFRAEVWGQSPFRERWQAFTDDWAKKEALVDTMLNAVGGSSRI